MKCTVHFVFSCSLCLIILDLILKTLKVLDYIFPCFRLVIIISVRFSFCVCSTRLILWSINFQFLPLKLYNLHILIDLLRMSIFYRHKKYISEIWNILIYNIKYISWIKRNPPLWIVQISFHDSKSNSLYLMD